MINLLDSKEVLLHIVDEIRKCKWIQKRLLVNKCNKNVNRTCCSGRLDTSGGQTRSHCSMQSLLRTYGSGRHAGGCVVAARNGVDCPQSILPRVLDRPQFPHQRLPVAVAGGRPGAVAPCNVPPSSSPST
ncbi:hypothetical protein C2845_PM09G15150 [Panicum miliaceum]|uniref:Uncharacterized protein n=1 Tax=Panicum miliaceum TaxID=4540 RepID=A0A3L6S0P7_PANMI|nr:hypothetical protein C2845_PM09G15150 [Panicum miliaceum]